MAIHDDEEDEAIRRDSPDSDPEPDSEPASDESPARGRPRAPTPAAQPAGPVRTRRFPGALLAGIVGLMVGLAAGGLFGRQLGRRQSAPSAPCPSASASGPCAPAGAPAATALAIDLGTLTTSASLEGTWNPRVRMDNRDVALTTGKTARIILNDLPQGRNQVLAVVAKAAGVKLNKTLDVVLTSGDQELAHWNLPARWSLVTLPSSGARPDAGGWALDLTIPDWAAQADPESAGPAVAIDQIHVGSLEASARLDLRTTNGRAALLNGFYAVEGPGCDEPWVWSQGQDSTVGLLVDPVSGGYQIKIHAAAFDQLAPLGVDVRVNGRQVGSLELGELAEKSLDVPDGLLTAGANTLELHYPRTARPSELVKGSTDDRELALRLYAIALTPVAR